MRTEPRPPGTGDRSLDLARRRARTLVLGPVGAGRSTFLERLADAEASADRRVWWCRGRQLGQPTAEPALLDASLDELGPSAAAQPTTVLVDDAHLLEEPLLDRLGWLAERAEDLGLRIAVSRAPVRPPPALARLDQVLVGTHGAIHLGPLDPDELTSEELAETGGWADLVAARRAGPGALVDLVTARVDRLDPTQRAVVECLAHGLPVGSPALLAASGRTAPPRPVRSASRPPRRRPTR